MSIQAEKNQKEQLISLPEAAEISGFNPKYLAQLAKKGRLSARKIGGIWVTTRVELAAYISSRQKRGAYRKDIDID